MNSDPTVTLASARWSCRLALFAVCLLLVTLVLHRFASLPTPLAMNLSIVAAAGAGLAVLAGLATAVRIWITGEAGAGSAALAVALPLLAFAFPLAYLAAHLDLPHINDVTTNADDPPAFETLAKRPVGANSIAYPGRHFAELQAIAYPDLRHLILEDHSAEEAFELAEEAIEELNWNVVAEVAPREGRSGLFVGRIEATEQTLIAGFTDDIVIRITGGERRARIDARSASRYGTFDFGQNAARLLAFFAEVRSRAEATPAAAVAAEARSGRGSNLKRRRERDRR